MADPDFKNMKFAYVRVVNGYPSIDASMTDRIFQTTKPDGYYHCFIFPKEYFSGVDHGDLRNLVSIEKSSIWDETLRSTLLGYNAVSNEFILNLTAYYGLKDNDLKTSGKLKYSGQASWQVMKLTTVQQSDSIVTLKQTNGTNVYLSIKPIESIEIKNFIKVFPSLSIEIEKKSIKDVPLLVKDDMLWAKSTEDGVPIMVNNCVKNILVSATGKNISLSNNNKEYGYNIGYSNGYYKSMRFGKELIYFDSISTTKLSPLLSFEQSPFISNKTGTSSIEYTDTSSLSDILASGESLVFQLTPKDKYVWGYQTKSSNNKDYPNAIIYGYNPRSASRHAVGIDDQYIELTEFINKNIIGYEYSLISCDTRKPFLFNSLGRIYGFASGSTSKIHLDANTIFTNLPDGYIALMLCVPNPFIINFISILRWKKGENPKYINVPSNTINSFTKYLSINGTTQFDGGMYNPKYNNEKLTDIQFDLDDVVNATGFKDIGDNSIFTGLYFPFVTIVRL